MTTDDRQPIGILHLSDLHFKLGDSASALVGPLREDLCKLDTKLAFVVVSGDFVDKGCIDAFPVAIQFLRELHEITEVPYERFILCPGNHDVQDVAGLFMLKDKPGPDEETAEIICNDAQHVRVLSKYQERFTGFRSAIRDLTGDDRLSRTYSYPEYSIQFITLNTANRIDKYRRKEAAIDYTAFSQVAKEADSEVSSFHEPLVRIAVCHHAVEGQWCMKAPEAFLQRLARNGFSVLLHGDVHEPRAQVMNPHQEPVSIVGAGSMHAPDEARSPSMRYFYNLLKVQRNLSEIIVNVREQKLKDGVFDGYYEFGPRESRCDYYTIDSPHIFNKKSTVTIRASVPTTSQSFIANAEEFVTNATEDDKFAKAIFGPFSYEKRFRDSPSRCHYFSRSVDAILDERLSRDAWILVAGHPLAGKTRAVVQAFHRLKAQKGSFAIWPFYPPPEANQPLSLPTFPSADRRIIWLDDIDARFRDLIQRGYSSSHINAFLEGAAAAGVILWATIRTGPTYYDFRHRFGLEEHLWDKLEAVIIPRIQGEEERQFGKWYQASFGAVFPEGFDHHPGSLFLNLDAMQQRWHNLAAIIRASGIEVEPELAKDVMRALHAFYLMEAFGPGGTFLGEDIYYYVRRNIERRSNRGTMQSAITTALALPQQLDREVWQKLLLLLSQNQYHLGFLQQEEGTLQTETAYLDYVVGPEANPDILRYVEENLSEDERTRLGLTITRYNFQDVFRRVELTEEKSLEKLARRLKSLQLHRNAEVWNQVIAQCPAFGLAHKAISLMTAAGVAPNVVTFNTLMAKAKDFESAQGVIDKMTAAGVAPDVVTFNSLFSKHLQGVDPEKLLLWYWGLKYHPEVPLQACIASYRRAGEIEHALMIALHYPHLAAAQKVMKENREVAVQYFQTVVHRLPSDGDANYALGLVLLNSQEKSRAIPHLEIALSDAKTRTMSRRIDHIQRILSDLATPRRY